MDRPLTTVLVIDDYDSVRIAISLILERNGFQVFSAESTETGKSIWIQKKQEIDVLIVDISMAAMSGPDLIRELQQRGLTAPVIFMTGISEPQAREATREMPDAVILHKPFPPDLLIETIQSLCGHASLAAR